MLWVQPLRNSVVAHTQLSDPMFQIKCPSLHYLMVSCFAPDEALLKPRRFISSNFVPRGSMLWSEQAMEDWTDLLFTETGLILRLQSPLSESVLKWKRQKKIVPSLCILHFYINKQERCSARGGPVGAAVTTNHKRRPEHRQKLPARTNSSAAVGDGKA